MIRQRESIRFVQIVIQNEDVKTLSKRSIAKLRIDSFVDFIDFMLILWNVIMNTLIPLRILRRPLVRLGDMVLARPAARLGLLESTPSTKS